MKGNIEIEMFEDHLNQTYRSETVYLYYLNTPFKKKLILQSVFNFGCPMTTTIQHIHHQGCVDPNNKLIVVYPIVTHVVTLLSSQCDVINSSRGTLTSHCDVIWKILHFEVRSSSF